MGSKNSLISKLARNLDATGDITANAIASTVSLGAKIYASRANLPSSGNTAGDQAYVTDNNRLYIWNGSGWYNVALLNVAPAISSVTDSNGGVSPFALSIDGVATTITITAADSDGDPITYTATADSNFAGLGTISQADNVFTITPFSQDSATTESGTITFTATDGVNVASSGIQTFTLSFLSPYWDETALSIGTSSTNGLANSTFIDRSTNAHTVTTSGSPVQTVFHPYLDNWSVEFDGSGDTLKSPTSADFAFGTGDFTVEFWLLYRGGNGYRFFWNLNGGSDYIGYGLQNGTLTPWLWQDTDIAVGNTDITPNVWQHHAVVRENGVFKIYLNGVEIASSSYTLNIAADKLICIGGNGVNNTQDTNGIYSNFRVVKGTALYTANFTPPTGKLTAIAGTSLLTCQSNRFIDNSSNAYAITPAGNVKISAFNPFGQESEYAVGENKGSGYFDGSSILTNTSANMSLSNLNDWTVEFWYYTSSTSGTQIVIAGDGATSGAFESYFSSGSMNIGGALTAIYLTIGSSYLPVNAWTHIAVVHYTSGIATAYANGVVAASGPWNVDNSSTGFKIGGYTSQYKYNGYVSDIRISRSTAVYASAFTPPTSPVGNANADLYLPMDNAGIYDKTGNHTLRLNGDTSTSTTQKKYANSSIAFSNRTLVVNYSPAMNIDNNDFTMEMWVYPTVSTGGTLWSFGYDAQNRLDFGWQVSTGIRLLIETSNVSNVVFTSTDDVSTYLNSWVHIAVVRSGNNFTLYVNGTSTAAGTSTLSIVEDTTDGWTFGGREFDANFNDGAPNDPFSGYLENIQFIRSAKYTTNFTPPTSTQGRNYQAES